MVAAFLRPLSTGTGEEAPRLRAVVPSLVAGALLLAGFGALGVFKPEAPSDWAEPGTRVIVGKDSTTRYVVLSTGRGRKKQILLHPVLNLASARLLLTPQRYSVVQVGDGILDAGTPPRGPVLGIPYAPDRLPGAEEAARPKRWAVCEQPGGGKEGKHGNRAGEEAGNGTRVQKAVFVLARRDFSRTEAPQRLTGGQMLYVRGQNGVRYLVAADGTKYRLSGSPGDNLTRTLVGPDREPQSVTDDWLATLHNGSRIDFPVLPGSVATDARAGGGLTPEQDRVGMVLSAQTGAGPQQYVVLPGEVRPVSDFTGWLLVNSPQTDGLDMAGRVARVDAASISPERGYFGARYRWPAERIAGLESAGGRARDTVCSVLRSVDGEGRTTLSVWAGTTYPKQINAWGESTYVTPGSGLLYTQVQGEQSSPGGSLFLLTDTGLRYAVQANGDSDTARSDIGAGDPREQRDGRPEPSQAQIRLGYEGVTPTPVPIAWSELLSKGPRLDTNSARRPQGS